MHLRLNATSATMRQMAPLWKKQAIEARKGFDPATLRDRPRSGHFNAELAGNILTEAGPCCRPMRDPSGSFEMDTLFSESSRKDAPQFLQPPESLPEAFAVKQIDNPPQPLIDLAVMGVPP